MDHRRGRKPICLRSLCGGDIICLIASKTTLNLRSYFPSRSSSRRESSAFDGLALNFSIASSIVSSMPDHESSTEAFELQPRLVGELLEVRPLTPDDWERLFAVASDPLIWEQHPARDRYQEKVFREFFREALESGGALVVIDRKTQEIIGSSRYFGFNPAKSEIEIGWTFLARSHWGGRYNGELKQLMLDHAFRFLDSVIFVIGETNFRSRKAVEKIGGVLAGRRPQTDAQGTSSESIVYQIRKSLRRSTS
jgi:RimJ/RimL family protein N-acetyltransferase